LPTFPKLLQWAILQISCKQISYTPVILSVSCSILYTNCIALYWNVYLAYKTEVKTKSELELTEAMEQSDLEVTEEGKPTENKPVVH